MLLFKFFGFSIYVMWRNNSLSFPLKLSLLNWWDLKRKLIYKNSGCHNCIFSFSSSHDKKQRRILKPYVSFIFSSEKWTKPRVKILLSNWLIILHELMSFWDRTLTHNFTQTLMFYSIERCFSYMLCADYFMRLSYFELAWNGWRGTNHHNYCRQNQSHPKP